MQRVLHPSATARSRSRAIAALAIVVVLIAAACETTMDDNFAAKDLVNASRASYGVSAVEGNIDLDAEADEWAQHMRNTCSLSHRPNITAGVPAGWSIVAENVGYGGSLSAAHNGFMSSPAHRTTITNSQLTHVGIGVVHGNCWGWNNTWVVQIFMRYTG